MSTCPLCSVSFDGREAACRGCGLATYCTLIRCPNCGYEFVEESRTVRRLTGWIDRLRGRKAEAPPTTAVLPLSQGALEEDYRVVSIVSREGHRLSRLTSLGIHPGGLVQVSQRHPSFVLRCGETMVALDREVVRDIYVRKASDPDQGGV